MRTYNFVSYLLNVSDLIENRYIFLNICSDNVLVSTDCDDVNPISFFCELLTWYMFYDLLDCCWLFYSNSEDPYIGSISRRQIIFPKGIVCWLVDIVHVLMITVLGNDTNRSTSWWKSYSNFKYIIFDEGVIWEINFQCWKGGNICASNKSRTGWPYFSKFMVMFIKFCIWTIFNFIGMQVPLFNCRSTVGVIHEWYFLCPII